MRFDPIEKKVLRAVGVTLALVVVMAAALALYGRYRVFTEQKEAERRLAYETEMARLMDQELLAEGMSRAVVRATLGVPDSIRGVGELVESWYYGRTLNYGAVILQFQHDQLVDIESQEPGITVQQRSVAPPPR